MLKTPRVPWFVVLAIAVAAAAVWEQTVMRKERAAQEKELIERQKAATPAPLPPPAPALEIIGPQKGSVFAQGAPIDHAWTPLPGAQQYQLDFAVPQKDGGCSFDAPRVFPDPHASLSHDDASPCLVWRVRANGQVAGSSYTVGAGPGCTLPPSAMVLCLESR